MIIYLAGGYMKFNKRMEKNNANLFGTIEQQEESP